MTTNEPPPYPGPENPEGGATPPPPGGMPPPPPPPPAEVPTAAGGQNKKALWALILGILGLVCCGLFTGIPALILGLQAKKEIEATGGDGGGMALAGIILGSVAIAWSAIYLLLIATGSVDVWTSTT